jgi:2-polyprenyl-6-hydroxyphenyl methylase/3-demethylubiquinone-9 3-methyltransferase
MEGAARMSLALEPVCARRAPCKCCGADAPLCGVVDFHKNCESHRRRVLGLSGVPVYYHRCPICRFLFTTAFDRFTKEDFLLHVYNDEYLLVDPDYAEVRPRANASFLSGLFPQARPGRLLDYGGGNGVLAESLAAAGFPQAETYDPFASGSSNRPTGRFDCITCFEVLEHATDPARTLADMSGLLSDPGLIVLSTMLQPADIDQQGLNWWYAGPRNGHVSLYSREGLAHLAARFGLALGSFNDAFHVLFRQVPEFARHFLRN